MSKGNSISYLGATICPEGPYWRAYLTQRGKGRLRYRRKSLDEVKKWVRANAGAAAEGLEAYGPAQAAEYRAAMEILLPAGVGLLEAVRIAADASPRASGGETLGKAAGTYVSLLTSTGRRKRTVESVEWALRKLALPADTPVRSITPAQIAAAVDLGRSKTTKDNIRRQISGFFQWCIRSGIRPSNPCAAIPSIRKDYRPPAIYTPEQVAALFKAAEEHYPKAIPYLALSFFSGCRSSAILELTPGSFQGAKILVHAAADKLRRSYYTDLTSTARRWLKAYPMGPKAVPWAIFHFTRRVTKLIHAKAGVARIPNGARHSFASYLLAKTNDAPWVAMQLGHFGDTKTLFSHYRRLATAKSAAKYFAVAPKMHPKPTKKNEKRA